MIYLKKNDIIVNMKTDSKNKAVENESGLVEKIVDEDPSHVCKVDGKRDIRDITNEEDNMLSKRPWSNSAKEVSFMMPDGTTKNCWMMSVVDANGDTICFGKTADMKFITEMENAFNGIADMLESNKSTTETALEVIKSFKR